jgi:plastocyanin
VRRATLRRAAAAALLATSAALGLAACGSSSSSPAAPVATTSVDMPRSYRFAPVDIVVDVGATVTWTNSDNFTHSVQFKDGGLPDDPMVVQPGGAPVTFTFTKAGTFHYQCSFHPTNMRGTVTVR